MMRIKCEKMLVRKPRKQYAEKPKKGKVKTGAGLKKKLKT